MAHRIEQPGASSKDLMRTGRERRAAGIPSLGLTAVPAGRFAARGWLPAGRRERAL